MELIVWTEPPNPGRPYLTPGGLLVCGAKKDDGYRCMSPFLCPNGRCKQHGGKSTGPTLVHGKRSRFADIFKGGLADSVREYLSDPDLLSVREDIALYKSRRDEALAGMPTPEDWAEADRLYHLAIGTEGDQHRSAMKELGAALARGSGGSSKWSEVERLEEKLRRFAETENRIASQKGQTLNRAVLLLMIIDIQTEIERAAAQEVSNPHERTRLISRIFRSLGSMVSRGTRATPSDNDAGDIVETDA